MAEQLLLGTHDHHVLLQVSPVVTSTSTHLSGGAASAFGWLLLQATCSDNDLNTPDKQPYNCPPGYGPTPGSEMATPPDDNTCCVVSTGAGLWHALHASKLADVLACLHGGLLRGLQLLHINIS
jgi:hypothetical protein